MEQESAEAAARAVLALWLSGGAVFVAFVAAGFTYWQAYVQHRIWSASQKADWVFESDAASGWFLRNAGGGHATNVTLTVDTIFEKKPQLILPAVEHIPAGGRVLLARTQQRQPPGELRVLSEQTGRWVQASRSQRDEAKRIYAQWATVTWTDEKRKNRKKRIAIY